jgi:iron complex outermembrane receptor protein
MPNKLRYLSALLAGAAFAAPLAFDAAAAQTAPPPPNAQASGTIEEVVVTARRREERLQTTPVAVTALTSQTLEKNNVVSLSDVSRLAPSLTIYPTSGDVGGAGMFMRGIGYADTAPGQDNPIGVYIDGVSVSRLAVGTMDLVEPSSVEVLRGPQGTLFGRNTTGGAILITTHTPSNDFGGEALGGVGNFGSNRAQFRIDTGLIANTGIKATFAYQHRHNDGTFNALRTSAEDDPGAQTSDAYWFKAVGDWGPLSAIVSADYSKLSGVPTPLQIVAANANAQAFLAQSVANGGGTYPIVDRPLWTLDNAYAGQQSLWSQGYSANLNYRINDYLAVKSITALRAYRRNDPSAYGPADIELAIPGTPGITTAQGFYNIPLRGQGAHQLSQELQASGAAGDFDYVGGFYYFKEKAYDSEQTKFLLPDFAFPILLVSPRTAFFASQSKAVYAQGDWKPSFLDRKFELSGGVRWTNDTRDFNETQGVVRTAHLSTDNVSYLVSASYRWTGHAMTYVRYSTGYRAGGFNVRAGATANPAFAPEHLKSLEGGFKLDMLDNRVRLNGAAYYNTYQDLQLGAFVAGSGGSVTTNANAVYQGYEVELQAIPVQGLNLSASVGYIDPRYKNYPTGLNNGIYAAAGALNGGAVSPGCTPLLAVGAAPGSPPIGQDCAHDAKFQYFPKLTADFSIGYTAPATSYGVWSGILSYSYKTHIEFEAFDSPSSALLRQPAYGLLSGRIALSDIPLNGGHTRAQIAVFGDNLTDQIYDIQGIDFGTAPGPNPNGPSRFATANYGNRRTFGVEAKIDF